MATSGVNFLVYVNMGDEPIVQYAAIAGQRGATLNRSMDTIDTTSKDSEGFKENEAGFIEWSIDFDGLLIEDDAGYMKLEEVFLARKKVKVRFETAAGNKYEGHAILTDFPIEGPYDGEATYSGTLTGTGKYTKVDAA